MSAGTTTTLSLLNSSRLIALHDDALRAWYENAPTTVNPEESLETLVPAQHFCNFSLWNHEDEARRRDVSDTTIAETKRAIDAWNQKRNDLIERIDQNILQTLESVNTGNAALHSETAGMMVDRLSILSLKIHHMGEYARTASDPAIKDECVEKKARLETQRHDLAACLDTLLAEFEAGTRYFKIYRQYKAYNDARLNPSLRKRKA